MHIECCIFTLLFISIRLPHKQESTLCYNEKRSRNLLPKKFRRINLIFRCNWRAIFHVPSRLQLMRIYNVYGSTFIIFIVFYILWSGIFRILKKILFLKNTKSEIKYWKCIDFSIDENRCSSLFSVVKHVYNFVLFPKLSQPCYPHLTIQ